MDRMDGNSLNIEKENIEKFKEVFPEIFTEGKVDFEKLQLILGQDIEDKEERYNFNWNGKRDSIRLSQTPTTGTLRPDKENSKDWNKTENIYIEGDNLEVLKLLQKSYHNKIKMIYIDPPYNTGKDFVYKDNYRDNIKNYLKFTGQVDEEGRKLSTNSDVSGRYHTDWLNMMYPRLRLARNLLTDDGVIFISIDDNEVHNLRKICDEIFGEDNFITSYIWRKKTGAADSKNITTITEYVLCYAKDSRNSDFSLDLEGFNKDRYNLEDEYVDERGKHYIDNLDRGGIRYSDSLNYGIECPDGTITYPNGRLKFKNDGWTWTWGKDKVNWGIENGFIVFRRTDNKASGWGVYYKNYLKVNNKNEQIIKGVPHKNVISDIINTEGTKEMGELFSTKIFQYTKPSRLIQRLLKQTNNENSIILDFFAGSSTTAHAVMDLNAEDGGNRKFIMVQIPEPTDEKSEAYKAGYKTISEIGRERIRRAGEKILEDNKDKEEIKSLDIGFKSFKLDTSNIKKWNPDYIEEDFKLEDMVDNLVPNREKEDLLYEIILKYGINLGTSVQKYKINNNTIYSVESGSLFVCLDNNIDENVINKIIKLNKKYKGPNPIVVFKDNGFKNDEIKLNAKLNLNHNGIEEVVSV